MRVSGDTEVRERGIREERDGHGIEREQWEGVGRHCGKRIWY